ncbi:AsmA family protein [Pseudoalteromonas piscicida]|uniref:AsmA family protein n=1 Tax=Pseudoalteromonas piscicida TaxID=43662 RepID=UPI0005FA142E|nr:AsmA family protein [Pseudoalteromonas piscicida]KJZ04889.1 membrane assembly protein AsmA [Pseudoalteromonas piscicida]
MNRLVKIVGAIVALIIILVIAAPFLIPKQAIIDQVTSQVESVTGRKLSIDGDSDIGIFPTLHIELNQVRFANMATGSRPDMFAMEQLAVHIPWLSALSGEAKLERFVINNPKIILETDKQGNANWQLLPTSAENTPTAQTSSKGNMQLPEGLDVSLGEVAIYGGSVTYLDGVTGAEYQVTDLDISVMLSSLYQPLEVDGKLTFQGQTFNLVTTLDNPAKAIEGEAFNVEQQVKSALFNLDYKGEIAEQGKTIRGQLALSGDSVKALAKWQGVDLKAKENAFNDFGLNAKMTMQGQVFTLNALEATLDELVIKGQSKVTLSGKPDITASVDLGMLDLNPYLPEPVEKPQTQPESEGAPAQPIVWDDTAIDLSALNSLNANVKITSIGLRAREIKLGENQISLVLNSGKATLSLDKFQAYEGQGKGKVVVNAATKPYAINTDFALTAINAEPLLTDAIGFDKVLGKGSLNWALNTQGVSQKQFVNALGGKLGFEFKDGGVKGANLAEMIRKGKEMLKGDFSSVSQGLNANFDPDQKTDFSAMTGTFVFTKGVGQNDDFSLASPLLRVTGKGTVDLPQTLVDYRVVTGIVDTIEGQASSDDSTGFKIPVRIKGPFHKVETSLDLKEAAKDKAKDKVNDKVKDKLKGLFGG